jgi:hypothetical protein
MEPPDLGPFFPRKLVALAFSTLSAPSSPSLFVASGALGALLSAAASGASCYSPKFFSKNFNADW